MSKAKLNPILFNLSKVVTEEVKRPDHPDFLTTSELKAKEWSGVRLNSLIDTFEFWVAGSVVKTLAASIVKKDYMALERAHVELFGISTAHPR